MGLGFPAGADLLLESHHERNQFQRGGGRLCLQCDRGCHLPPTVTATPPSGSWFAIGTTTVNVTAKDSCGDLSNGSFTITITEPPLVLDVPTNTITVTATSTNGTMVYFTVSASGGCAPPPNLSANPPPGSEFPVGTNTVTASAWDGCGQATNATLNIVVLPARPALTLQFGAVNSHLVVAWSEAGLSAGTPVFGLETLPLANLSAGAEWSPFTNGFVRRINDNLLANDFPAGGAFYRLNSLVTNPVFIPSAATLPASGITTSGTVLNGTAMPLYDQTVG